MPHRSAGCAAVERFKEGRDRTAAWPVAAIRHTWTCGGVVLRAHRNHPAAQRPDPGAARHCITSRGPAAARAVSQRRAVTTRAGVFGGMGRQGIPRLGGVSVVGRGLGRGLGDLGGAGLVRRVGARLVRFEDAGAHGVEALGGLRAARGGSGDFFGVRHVVCSPCR